MNKKLIAIMTLSMFLLSYMALTPIVANIYNSFPNEKLENIQIIVTLIPLFSVVTMFLCNPLSKKISMKNIGIIGLILITLGGAFTYIFHRYIWQLYVSSILLGLGIGLINVISSSMISYYFDGEEKMKVMGYQSIFVSIGGTLFSYLSGLLAKINWPYSYLCFFLALIVVVINIAFLPNDKLESESKTKEKLPKRIYLLGVISILFFISINVFNTSIALLLENLGYKSDISGLVTAIYTLIGLFAGFILNKVVKIFKTNTLTFACAIATIGFFLIATKQIILIFIGSALLGFAFATRNPAGITFSANMVTAAKSALAIAIFNGAGQLGAFLSPYIINFISNLFNSNIVTTFTVSGIFMLIVTIIHLLLNPIKKEDLK